jgi:hypothetical protein
VSGWSSGASTPPTSVRPGEILLGIEESTATVPDRARAWATEHGNDRLVPILDKTFVAQLPDSGFALTINKPTQLMVLVTWPWCPQLQPR